MALIYEFIFHEYTSSIQNTIKILYSLKVKNNTLSQYTYVKKMCVIYFSMRIIFGKL